jgi:hypothetical protein
VQQEVYGALPYLKGKRPISIKKNVSDCYTRRILIVNNPNKCHKCMENTPNDTKNGLLPTGINHLAEWGIYV